MELIDQVLNYKCPCCDAPLVFGANQHHMRCDHCGNSFPMEGVKAYNDPLVDQSIDQPTRDNKENHQWSDEDSNTVRTFTCPSCGGELMTDDTTAATFCPYCDNPTIIASRLSGGIRPDYVLPFSTKKEDAQVAFRKLCKKKLLLPKGFSSQTRIEKITGMYVPFWLYTCDAHFQGRFKATKERTWEDWQYYYTRTSYYALKRDAVANFHSIPLDASSKLDNTIMESIEPFDFDKMRPFDTAYLSGFFADRYDVSPEQGHARTKERVTETLNQQVSATIQGFATAEPSNTSVFIHHSKADYVLLPVWMLYSKYKDKTYVFAMNGQTGKMTGSFPICPVKSFLWFSSIFTAVTAVAMLIQYLAM
jgi:predicted RNA-binding Zn-ribbon protein involved in translation (DUF1610 family)